MLDVFVEVVCISVREEQIFRHRIPISGSFELWPFSVSVSVVRPFHHYGDGSNPTVVLPMFGSPN